MKKTLYSIALSVVLIGTAHSSFALSSCAAGDKFDIFTGKSCVVSTSTSSTINDKDALIASLQTQIATLLLQVDSLKSQITSTNASSTKEAQLKAIDAQILPLLAIDTSNTPLINQYLAQYKTIDTSFSYKQINSVSPNLQSQDQIDKAYVKLNSDYLALYNYLVDKYIPNRNK